MRGNFSIEWMAQSSQPSDPETLAACGTHAESLPGFYCRQKTEHIPEQQKEQQQQKQKEQQQRQQKQKEQQQQQQKQREQQQQQEVFSLCSSQRSHSTQGVEGFSSGTEEETSGYESEGGRSVSPAIPAASPASPPPGRRPRTAFTAEQVSSLERAFNRNTYLGTQDKAELCKKLNLSDKQIRNWFQNRRMKLKRTVQDALAHACQANVASQFLHYPELQAYRPGPYTRYQQEVPAAASYLPAHSLQLGSSLPLDSFYQYSSLPPLVLPSAASQLPHYPTYPQYY